MNITSNKRATNPAAALDGTELVYVAQLGDDAVTTMDDIKRFVSLESIIVAASNETTALTTGTSKITFRMPLCSLLIDSSSMQLR